jgi:hypothetical protein
VGLAADFVVDPGMQATTVKLVPASDEPSPTHAVGREAAEKLVIEGLGLTPLGKPWVATYKVADFARKVGVAAVELETRATEAKLMLISADGALLEGLRARGADLATDSKAKAALERLRAQVSDDASGPYRFLGRALVNQAPYALADVGIKKAVETVVGNLAGTIAKWLPLGDQVKYVARNRGTVGKGLRLVGWTKIGERARVAAGYTDKLTKSLIKVVLNEFIARKVKEALAEESATILREILEENPSRRVTVGGRARLELALRPQAAVPALAVAARAAEPAAEVLRLPAEPVAVYRDPVARAISVDDSFIRSSSRRDSSEHSSSSSSGTATQTSAPEPSGTRSLTSRGSGLDAKPPRVSGSWDGRRGGSLFSK